MRIPRLDRLAESVRRWPDRWCAGVLIALPVLLFGRGLLPGVVFSPAEIIYRFYPWAGMEPGAGNLNPCFGDVGMVFHPWLVYAARELGDGRLPLWNPHAFAGTPFLGNMQSALLSPFNAVACVLPLKIGLVLAPVMKMWVAGLSMYWFLRQMALAPLPSLLGALSYMLGGFMVAWLHFPLSGLDGYLGKVHEALESPDAPDGYAEAQREGLPHDASEVIYYPSESRRHGHV